MAESFQQYLRLPSAIISDGALATVPLWAVTQMVVDESYHLPAIGSTGMKAAMPIRDDTIKLTGVLVGPLRFTWKLALETMAESSKRGTPLAAYTKGAVSGLFLVSSMTIRTDLQVQSLSFTATAAKRETLDVVITLASVPRPSVLGKILDVASVGVGLLRDFA